MRRELTAPSVEQLMTDDRSGDPLTDGRALIDECVGPITTVERVESAHDLGLLTTHVAEVQRVSLEAGFYDPSPVQGTAISPRRSEITAIGEAVERYCLGTYDRDGMVHATAEELSEPTLQPSSLCKLSATQLSERGLSLTSFDEESYDWTATRELTDGTVRRLPADVVYLPVPAPDSVRPRLPTTVGAAAGRGFRSAVFRGLCEVIERDHFVVSYLNEVSLPRMALADCADPTITALRSAFRAAGREVYAFDMSIDMPVAASLAVAVDRTAHPAVRVGLGCDRTMREAVADALVEAFRVKPWNGPTETFSDPHEVRSIATRRRFWADHDRIEELSFLLDTEPTEPVVQTDDPPERRETLTRLLDEFADEGRRCYVADLTTAPIRHHGFVAVKVVVPSLHPLHMLGYRYLGGDRLYEAPVDAGLLETRCTETELNDTPHPML